MTKKKLLSYSEEPWQQVLGLVIIRPIFRGLMWHLQNMCHIQMHF